MTQLPPGPFSILYADPPWHYDCGAPRGAAHKHYATASFGELASLPVARIAAKDAALFMWATWPMLPDGLLLMSAWGFTYKTCGFLWAKQNKSGKGSFMGMGRWSRGNTEACLIGLRGKPKRASAAVRQLIESPRAAHSEKPAEIRSRIVQLCGDLPRVELFARQAAPGWTIWGDEAPQEAA